MFSNISLFDQWRVPSLAVTYLWPRSNGAILLLSCFKQIRYLACDRKTCLAFKKTFVLHWHLAHRFADCFHDQAAALSLISRNTARRSSSASSIGERKMFTIFSPWLPYVRGARGLNTSRLIYQSLCLYPVLRE